MPVSEHELRDLMRERSAAVPTTPELAQRVQQRVRRRRRLEAGGLVAALVMVLLATGLVVLPRRDAATPVSATPTHRTTQTLGSLVVTTVGPTRIEGEQPFDVRLEVTNTGTSRWSGMVAAGLVTGGDVPGFIGENSLVVSAGQQELQAGQGPSVTQGPAAVADRSSAQQWYGLSVPSVVLEPGQGRSWTLHMKRNPRATVLPPILGWLPWIDADGSASPALYGALGQATPVSVTPKASDLACDTVTVTSAKVGQPGGWHVTEASTAVVGPDLKATWVPADTTGAPIPVVVTNDSDARDTTVMAAVSRYLNDTDTPVPATGYASMGDPLDATEAAPGSYVAYSGVRFADIAFSGTCGPSGQRISGTWTAFYRTASGILDCSLAPAVPPGTLAHPARRFCPA